MIIPFSPPDITEAEIQEVVAALRSGWITTGIRVREFERRLAEYIGTDKVVCTNSQTSAMELVLRILGIGEGDEVLVPAYTYTATASVVYHTGAKIVMLDVAPGTFELDYDSIADKITEKTKAILPVDIGGKMCDYERIFAEVEKKKALFRPKNELQESFGRVIVCADSAHGFGASLRGRRSGAWADFTTFSFHAVKNLTTGDGGAITWRSREGLDSASLYRIFSLYSLHGQDKDAVQRNRLGGWEYDVLYPAYKCNMTDTLAAIGIKQLERYPEMLAKRRAVAKKYDEAFSNLGVSSLLHFGADYESNCHLYMVRLPTAGEAERNRIIEEMAQRGVACNVHFKPLPMMTAYKNLGFDIKDFPVSYRQYQNEITLPLYSSLSEEAADYVSRAFTDVICGFIKK